MTREQFKYELDDTTLDYPIVDKVMEVWDYAEKKYAGEWYYSGARSCRCSNCGYVSNLPSYYCPFCGSNNYVR